MGGALIVDPGAVFEGGVRGSREASLQLGDTEGATGTLDMGGSFTAFGTIVFDAGAHWDLSGNADELADLQTITGFSYPDTLVLEGFTADAHVYVEGAGLELSNGTTTETLDITGQFSTNSFLFTDTSAGTEISLLCYMAGTQILTPAGECAVETLGIGDTVITRYNGYRRVKWIGRQSFARRFVEKNRDQIPVRILAGALGPSLPRRDLLISPGHSMLIGHSLVLAKSLVNGVTILHDKCPEEIHYYQLEFETHDCVMAEGAWSESFCDYTDLREQFHNVADFYRLYPDHVTPTEHLLCAPRPERGAAFAAALAPVTARAAACVTPGSLRGLIDEVAPGGMVRGWAQDIAHPNLPVLLEVLVEGRIVHSLLACEYRPDLAQAGIGRGRHSFEFNLPAESRNLRKPLEIRRASDRSVLPPSRELSVAA